MSGQTALQEQELAGHINKCFNNAKALRRRYDRDVKLNLAFYAGRPWVLYDYNMQRVIDYAPMKSKNRSTINMVMPVVRQEYAKLTAEKPTFTVVANTASQDNIAQARTAFQFLEHKIRTDKYYDILHNALLWSLISGTAFVKVFYDPNRGPQYQNISLGDIVVDYCSPLEIYVDPLARSVEEATWVIHARLRSLEYIEDKYGVKVPGEESESLGSLANLSLPSGSAFETVPESSIPCSVVKEYWERPNARNPEGRYAVIAGNKILYAGANPYAEVCPIPFVELIHIPVPGRLWGDSTITQLRSINVLYNKFSGDALDNAAKLSTPPMIAPLNAFEKPPQFTPGEILYYNPLKALGGRMEQLQVNPYPPQLMNILVRLRQERDDIAGTSEISRGVMPRGVRNPQAVSHALQQDLVKLAVTARNFEKTLAQTLNYVLKLAKAFYEIPRLIDVLGSNNQREAMLFRADNIPHDAEVFVEAGSTLAQVKEQKQQYLMSLWDRQIITDPRLILRSTDYGSNEELLGDINLDSSQAQRENDRMARGHEAEVAPYQNHVVHIVEHNRFRKTAEFENLSRERRALWEQHVSEHERSLPPPPPPPPAPIIIQQPRGGVPGVQVS